MIFRCRSCHSTVWVYTGEPAGEQDAACRSCGQRYLMEALKRTTEQRLFEESRVLAQQHSIDVPGAYSVLLGIMSVEEVRELGDGGSAACHTAVEEASTDTWRGVDYDAAFAPAVQDGSLTPRQAMERGHRETYAALLAKRHDLSMELAYKVADNKRSLLEALRQRDAAPRQALSVRVRSGPWRPVKWAAAAVLSLALASLLYYTKPSRPVFETKPVSQKVGSADVVMDSAGRVVQVQGPTPRSVLRTYCASAVAGRRFEAVDLITSGQPGQRLGLLRDPSDVSKLLALAIREDTTAGRWVAGDGRNPLVATEAPERAQAAVVRRH